LSLKSSEAGKRALISMHLSVLLWGLTGVLGRGIDLSEGFLVWYRIMIASFTLGIYAVLTNRFVVPSKHDFLKMTGIGVLLTVHWLFFYGAIKYSNISITLSMLASQALFTVFFEFLILRKPIAKSEIVFSLMAMAGIWIIFYSEQIFITGIILAIIASGVGSLFNIFNKPILETNEPVMVSLIEIGTGFLFLTCILPFYTSFFGIEKVVPDSKDWILLFILAFFCTHLTLILSLSALKYLDAFTLNLSINLEPIYGIALAFFLYSEYKMLNYRFFIGGLLILFSVLMHGYYQAKKVKQSAEIY
jgi:drug/metabolite transporter (DMT)-like permease